MKPEDRNRVLIACGYHQEWNCEVGATGWVPAGGEVPDDWEYPSHVKPTQQELWEGLCKACKGTMYHPRLEGLARVLLETFNALIHEVDPVSFTSEQYGSLTAAIEEAILWMLNQKGENNGNG